MGIGMIALTPAATTTYFSIMSSFWSTATATAIVTAVAIAIATAMHHIYLERRRHLHYALIVAAALEVTAALTSKRSTVRYTHVSRTGSSRMLLE
jgi:hypothetical protein